MFIQTPGEKSCIAGVEQMTRREGRIGSGRNNHPILPAIERANSNGIGRIARRGREDDRAVAVSGSSHSAFRIADGEQTSAGRVNALQLSAARKEGNEPA